MDYGYSFVSNELFFFFISMNSSILPKGCTSKCKKVSRHLLCLISCLCLSPNPYIPMQLFNIHPLIVCLWDRNIIVCYFLITGKNLTCKMMGWKVPLHCYFSPLSSPPPSSRFSDCASRAPLLSDDKRNFHVLCIINPSLPLLMPTPPLSPSHAWIAKESSLQLELIDMPGGWGAGNPQNFKPQIGKWINFAAISSI